MAELNIADMIWNRACGNDPLRSLPGDRALDDLLQAHSLVMNGGVLHAVECLTASELSGAEAGYGFYGLEGVASLLSRARRIFDIGNDLVAHERILDAEYVDLIPTDTTLVERFERRWKSNSSDYAPLRETDMG